MAFSFGQQPQQQQFGAAAQQLQDVKIPPHAAGMTGSCGDGISSLSFSQNNLLLASSWDSQLRVWQVAKQGQQFAAQFAGAAAGGDGPVLCACFNGDGTAAFCGGADNTVRMWQFGGGGQAQVIGRHDQPVKTASFLAQQNLLVTGGWDATVRFWDIRQPNKEAYKLQLNQKVYSVDVQFPLMVVCTAETAASQHPLVHLYSLAQNPPQLFQNQPFESTLKHQVRCAKVFNHNGRQGFALGSVEGRVEIKDLAELHGKRSFAFKCHRVKETMHGRRELTKVYPVNSIAFNHTGTFATSGGDGVFNFWDKESKTRIKEFKPGHGCRQQQAVQPGVPSQTIADSCFSATSECFAYAMSYDWSRGDDQAMKDKPNDIWLHTVAEDELRVQAAKVGGKK